MDDHRRRWDRREYEKKASDRIENIRSVKRKPHESDDDEPEERQKKLDKEKIARTMLQARQCKVRTFDNQHRRVNLLLFFRSI